MYRVNLAFMEDLLRIVVVDEDGTEVLKTVTMARPLLELCSLGKDYTVGGTVPALPAALEVQVNTEQVIVTNPADPDRPVLFTKSGLVNAIVKGLLHGKAKQVVERPDPLHGPEEGRNPGTCTGIGTIGHSGLAALPTGDAGGDGQTGPSEAAPL